jgi:hypothetical protein
MLHSCNSVGTPVSGFHCVRSCFANIIFCLWMPIFFVGGAWHKRVDPWVCAQWQPLCELQLQFPESGRSTCSSTLQAYVSSLPESSFTFSGKQNTRGGGMVSASKLVFFRSLTLTVLQHYVALYVCSVPLTLGRLKIWCTVNFVKCIWCRETDFSCNSVIMFFNTNAIDSMKIQNDQAVFLAYHVSSSVNNQFWERTCP